MQRSAISYQLSALWLMVTCAVPLAAQGASPYLPVQHWATPYVEHLIARGRMADPSPLTRPLKTADVVRALSEVDTLTLTRGERRVVRAIIADLSQRERGPWGRLDVHAGVAGASFDNEDVVRPVGPGHATFSGGLALTAGFGPVVAVTHPYFDTRLKFDPFFHGKKDRVIAGRNAEAYLSGQWQYGEAFFGSLDRNWGPAPLQGLEVSPAPYSYDHFGLAIGTKSVRLEGLIAQLDTLSDTSGTANNRYFVSHRLLVRPPGRTTIALWEGNVQASTKQGLSFSLINFLTLGLLQQYDEQTKTNSQLGLDVQTGFGTVTVFGSLLLDDIQVDKGGAGNAEPASYGLTVGGQGPLGPAAWTAFYTRVTNLTYRTPNPAEAVMRLGVGLGRNYSDYDQLTLRGSLLTGPSVLVTPEATLIRQGQGDFRLPYPPVAAYPTTPGFLAGVVERTVRLACGVQLDRGPIGITGNGGVHLISNADHITGNDKTQWVGTIAMTVRLHWESALP